MTDVATTTTQPGQIALLESNPEYRRLVALYNECAKLARSKFVPEAYKDDTDTVFALARYGEQYGLSPIHSVARLYVISGKIEPSADVLAALVMEHGHELRYDETSSERCTVAIRRAGTDYWQSLTWTIEDARRAGLLDLWVVRWVKTEGGKNYPEEFTVGHVDKGVDDTRVADAPEWVKKEIAAGKLKSKENWAKYPDDLLAAKAIRRAVKRFCPDVLLNLADQGDGMAAEQLVDPRVRLPTSPDESDPFDQDIVDAELVEDQGAPPTPDGPVEPPPVEDPLLSHPGGTTDEEAGERRAKLQRQLMATATKAFPKLDGEPSAQATARRNRLRHAATFVALKQFKSANDMDVDELTKVLTRLEDISEGRLSIIDRDGQLVAVQGDRELPIPAETETAAA